MSDPDRIWDALTLMAIATACALAWVSVRAPSVPGSLVVLERDRGSAPRGRRADDRAALNAAARELHCQAVETLRNTSVTDG